MNIYVTAVFAVLGAAAGLAAPASAQAISKYKLKKKGLELEKNARYTSILLKIALSILSAAVWGTACYFSKNVFTTVSLVLIFSAAVLVAVIDLRVRIIPNEMLAIMILLGLAFQISQYEPKKLIVAIICMVVMTGLFSIVAGVMGFNKVGAGDVKLAGVMGFTLGYPLILTALIIMAVIFALFSLGGILLKKLTLKSMLPFAPFMMAGLALTLVYTIIINAIPV